MVSGIEGARMADDTGLDYGRLMQRALRRLMAEALGYVAENGLPGDHHLYITFDPQHPGVVMPDWLKERHPGELTIVLQHEFWDLAVLGDRFQVGLSFNDRPAMLVIPFDAVQTFIDPSVKFGLKFDEQGSDGVAFGSEEGGEEDGAPAEGERRERAHAADEDGDGDDGPGGGGSAEVVNLDRFRKS
jgi:hypothetical protein